MTKASADVGRLVDRALVNDLQQSLEARYVSCLAGPENKRPEISLGIASNVVFRDFALPGCGRKLDQFAGSKGIQGTADSS